MMPSHYLAISEPSGNEFMTWIACVLLALHVFEKVSKFLNRDKPESRSIAGQPIEVKASVEYVHRHELEEVKRDMEELTKSLGELPVKIAELPKEIGDAFEERLRERDKEINHRFESHNRATHAQGERVATCEAMLSLRKRRNAGDGQ